MTVEITFPGNLGQVASLAVLRDLSSLLIDSDTLYFVTALGSIYAFDPGSMLPDNGTTVIRPSDRTPLEAGRFVFNGQAGTGPTPPPLPNDGLRPGVAFTSNYANGATTDASGLIYINANLATPKDLIRLDGTLLPGAASYHLHITSSAAAGVVAGGAMGIALSGAGVGSAGTFNRYEDGIGNGVLGQRVGSGNGSGLYASFAGTGVGAALSALKQNANGSIDPGQPHGLGPAIEATNSSEQGQSILSLTTANNASLVSNAFERRNISAGVVSRDQILLGGARTGLLTGHDVVIQPDTDSTGTAPVTGLGVVISERVKGSATAAGITIENNAGGSANGYGLIASATGANATNTAILATATGGTNNRAMLAFGDVALSGNFEPTADNTQNIGRSTFRFGTIYAGTGAINTSDQREKVWDGALTPAHLRAAKRIAAVIGTFRWIDSIAVKGEEARTHIGVKAQEVASIMASEGLETSGSTDFRHAFLCYDEDGEGGRYGLRHDQLALFLAGAQAVEIERLAARLA